MYKFPVNDLTRIYAGFNDNFQSKTTPYDFFKVGESASANGVRLELNDRVASGYWELFRPDSGILICVADGLYHRAYQEVITPKQDVITVRFVLSGKMSVRLAGKRSIDIPQCSASVLHIKQSEDFELTISGNSHLCSVSFHLEPGILRDRFHLEGDRLPPLLRDLVFGAGGTRPPYNFPMSAHTINVVNDVLKMRFEGGRRSAYAQAKMVELLCRLFQEVEDEYLGNRQILTGPKQSVRKKVHRAHQILIANYMKPPPIASLAREVGLNRSTLSAEFKKVFGISIFAFSQDYRLDKARELLGNRDLSIQEVAEIVGYDYAANFTAAFKRKYGLLPKDIRVAPQVAILQ